ncbi:hypothetical protein [Vibrio parahaemolyticus]|uniref:hypothetical protein n=1 Tax=Vibrio parahaemolyticus TaxID=670 RepID=UPI003D7C3762
MNSKISQFIALSKSFHLHESEFRLTKIDVNSKCIVSQVIEQAELNLIEIIKAYIPADKFFKTDVIYKIYDLEAKVIRELNAISKVYGSQISNDKAGYTQKNIDIFIRKEAQYRNLAAKLSKNIKYALIDSDDRILIALKESYERISELAIQSTRSKYLIKQAKSIISKSISHCSHESLSELFYSLETIEIATNRSNFMKTLLDNIKLYIPLIIADKYSSDDFEVYRSTDKNGLIELTALETSDVLMNIYESLLQLDCVNEKEICILKSVIYTHDYNLLFDYDL